METPDALSKLSKREQLVAQRFAQGLTYREISDELCIAPTTVRKHLSTIYRKLGVSTKIELLRALEDTDSEIADVEDQPKVAVEPVSAVSESKSLPLSVRKAVPLALVVLAIAMVAGWMLRLNSHDGGAGGPPLLAVLPFEGLGEVDHGFAEGLTEDLLTDLSKLSGLRVIARNSMQRYIGEDAEFSRIVSGLGADYVVQGNVRQIRDDLRVNARLIDARTGENLWAERFDRDTKDVFNAVDGVVAGLAAVLHVDISGDELARVQRLPTDNLKAYDYFVRAEQHARQGAPKPVAKALALYRQAFTADQKFADARAGYARAAVDALTFAYADVLPAAVAREQAYAQAGEALSIAPDLARGYSVLALLQSVDAQHQAALESASRAVELAPGSADARRDQAVVAIYAGQLDIAQSALTELFNIDPSPQDRVFEISALADYLDGNYDAALAQLAQIADRKSDLVLQISAAALARTGADQQAEAAISILLERWPRDSASLYRVLHAHFANPEHLANLIDGLVEAGLPNWPLDFQGDNASRVEADSLKDLTAGATWSGFEQSRPFYLFLDGEGNFVERGPNYQSSGTYRIDGNEICFLTSANYMGRSVCGSVYENRSKSLIPLSPVRSTSGR